MSITNAIHVENVKSHEMDGFDFCHLFDFLFIFLRISFLYESNKTAVWNYSFIFLFQFF